MNHDAQSEPAPSGQEDPSPGLAAARGGIGRHASVVGACTLASRLLGFLRDWCMGIFFAEARGISDAFLTAFAVPNLFRNLFGEGALTSSFLPVFVDERENRGDPSAARLAGAVLGRLAAFTGALAALAMLVLLAIDAVFGLEAPLSLTLRLTAWLFPFMPLICCAAILAAMLQGMRRFALPAALSVTLNLAFLAAFAWIYFVPCQGELSRLATAPEAGAPAPGSPAAMALRAMVAAVLLSGLAQVPLAWLRLASLGITARPTLRQTHPGLSRTMKVFVPAALGIGVVQANVFIDMILAYWLSLKAPGAKTCLYFGNQLMHFPLAIFGTAVASTAFPFFARHAARGEHAALLARVGSALRATLLLTAPAAVGLAVLADPVVRLLYQWPDLGFSHIEVYRASRAAGFYALGLPFFAAQMVLVRALYAKGDYRGPVRIATAMVGLNLLLNLTLIHAPDFLRLWQPAFNANAFFNAADIPLWRGGYAEAYGLRPEDFPLGSSLGESGLALATTLTSIVHTLFLGRALRRHALADAGAAAWRSEGALTLASAWRVALAALGMGLLTHWFANSIPYEPELPMRLERALAPMGLGVAAYFALGLIVPVPEIEAAAGAFWRRLRRRGGRGE